MPEQMPIPESVVKQEASVQTNAADYDWCQLMEEMIETGHSRAVIDVKDKLEGVSDQEIVDKLLAAGRIGLVRENIKVFSGLNQATAIELIKAYPRTTLENLEHFDVGDINEFMEELLEMGYIKDVVWSISNSRFRSKFTLNQRVAEKIIAVGDYVNEVLFNLDSFTIVDGNELINQALQAKNEDPHDNYGSVERGIIYNLAGFRGLSLETAIKIASLAKARVIEDNEDFIPMREYSVLPMQALFSNLDAFEGFTLQEFASALIESGHGEIVTKNFGKFYQNNDEKLQALEQLIDAGVTEGLDDVFLGMKHEAEEQRKNAKTDNELVEARKIEGKWLSRESAEKLLKAHQSYLVVRYIDKFKSLDQEIAAWLIERGGVEVVIEKIESFQNLDYQKLAEQLVAAGNGRLIFSNDGISENLDRQKLYEYVIENAHYLFLLEFQNQFAIDEEVFEQMASGGYKQLFTDPNVLAQFERLKTFVGEAKWKATFKKIVFWRNPHDNLLLVDDSMNKKTPEEQQEIADLVLKPFWSQINTRDGFWELRNNLQAFDLEKYRARNDGETPPFANYQAFGREAMLQRYDIRIPEGASENFVAAMEGLIEAKNVDVSFLRAIIDQYRGVNVSVSRMRQIADERLARGDDEDWDNDIELAEYREYFIARLINIIEGRDQIDEQKMIAPHRETIPLDPLHDLAFNAVGIHSLNQKGLKLAELVDGPEGLGGIFRLLQVADEQTKIRINENKKQALEKDQQKGGKRKDRLTAEYQKRLDESLLTKGILEKKDARINQSNIEDLPLLLDEGQLQKVGDEFAKLLDNDQALKQLVIEIYTDLAAKGPAVGRMIEWEQFASLADSGRKLGERLEEITQSLLAEKSLSLEQLDKPMRVEFLAAIRQEFSVAQLQEIAGDDFVKLALFSLYLGLNNRQKASESKDLKNGLDQILNVKKYKEQTKNPSLDYLQGKLAIDGETETRIRQLLDQYGYLTAGRQLELKIAKGSDYTAWTAGDQTDCCMPFASEKNREYLLRPDTAYFVCSIVDEDGQSEIIAQSVLVAAKDKTQPQTQITAFDNIEIANRAIKYRPVITQAYERMKQVLVERFETEKQQQSHQYQRLKLLIGTTYNDDGGLITGGLPATEINSVSPIGGALGYSDCFGRDHAHLYYDSEAKQTVFTDYGLQIDLFERSKIKQIVKEPQTLQKVKELLEKIGEGVDDGDGGLSFADNYSTIMAKNGKAMGFVVGADYLTDDNEGNYLTFEQVGFAPDLSTAQQEELLDHYLQGRKLTQQEDLEGVIFRPVAAAMAERFAKLYPEIKLQRQDEGTIKVNFGE